ncbi:MAG TPA: 3-phosphoserine/phosphohydroxythreonine transaminase [Marinilabiliales bacterium]|nr:MAG: phosphoserine transaminase [Bacteroidetes bacterium GWA2_40_14]OFX75217.1 MAG: phosphoserine transaminase [Bacteroidetes bacterium GWD2_40_43]OFX89814.1 MAG: phosphoserine transaminase [Bacteroidetes bacterium GWE2_40_63]OFY21993.1 MAG: phosphoserine transaminase [Bacteroidetes bacterium GWF2_40_13]HAM97045.1 3-phosphoserine/phosphohydroxythreonine transaminase [Marinilabiliales bacterium]
MRKHIFNAGPCKLSDPCLENTAKAILELNNSGQSILEVSHRSKDFEPIINEAMALFKEVLNIPDNYHVLFLGGGASLQFAMIPFNFLKTKAAYVDTGTWANKAIKEAKLFGKVEVIANSEDKNHTYYPKGFKIPADVDYLHITSNNTIRGTEIFEDLDSPVPLIADMSSDIMSRPVDVSKYAMIYGGAQKNLGPAGVTFVILRDDMLQKVVADRPIPSMLRYDVHIKDGSMYNTPPCVNIFALNETLKWVKASGGIKAMDRLANERADMLYAEIDRNSLFRAPVEKGSRSRMNIPFVWADGTEDLTEKFMELAKSRKIVGIKGHRSVGGFRASTYNACTIDDVKALVTCMQDFEKQIKG